VLVIHILILLQQSHIHLKHKQNPSIPPYLLIVKAQGKSHPYAYSCKQLHTTYSTVTLKMATIILKFGVQEHVGKLWNEK